jgi:hypothetical protein
LAIKVPFLSTLTPAPQPPNRLQILQAELGRSGFDARRTHYTTDVEKSFKNYPYEEIHSYAYDKRFLKAELGPFKFPRIQGNAALLWGTPWDKVGPAFRRLKSTLWTKILL